MQQEILQELSSLTAVAVRERDEAIQCLRQALAELAQLQKLFNNILLPEERQQALHYNYHEAMEETKRLQNCSYSHFSGNSLSRFSSASPVDFVSNPSGNSSPAISDSGSYSSSSNQIQDTRDYETVVMEMIGGVLPENGKFVQAVTEAGQLLGSLLITGPVPKWKNEPTQVSAQRPVMSPNTRIGHSITGNWNYDGLELGSDMLNRYFPCKKARFSLMS